MSASKNPDAVANQQGQFGSRIAGSEPMTTKGHQIGQKVSPADDAPEFSAKTLPPGSAPADRTFKPNPSSEVPSQADNDNVLRSHGKESTYTAASDTLGGSTSADVHTGMGKPMQGQTSSEMRQEGGKRTGLVGVGASGAASTNQMVDERVDPSQRGLERDEAQSGPERTYKRSGGTTDVPPASAEEVAAERD
ncbi:MAG: hypothetical protein M1830_004586 [Pleopsidium flavum]|nr:MAG: hypothetical protein M1830_004586 [Pleopsidium flavum]